MFATGTAGSGDEEAGRDMVLVGGAGEIWSK